MKSIMKTMPGERMERRWEVDWLRTLAVFLLFFFHSARIFDFFDPFYAKNEVLSPGLSWVVVALANPWFMPLFFLLAGASSWFALAFRSGGRYAGERFKRLFIPFLFGVLVIIPPQTYCGWLTNGRGTSGFLDYYPRFFHLYTQDVAGFRLGGFSMAHLWFIFFLFAFSLAALPLFIYLKGESGKRLIGRLAAFFKIPGMILVLAVLPAIAKDMMPFPNPLYYSQFFIYGYVLMADRRFEEAIQQSKLMAFILGPVLMVACFLVVNIGSVDVSARVEALLRFHRGMVAWLTLVAMLGYGRKYLNFTNRFLKYFSEASYPFYIIHQTVIVVLGFWVVQLDAGVFIKYPVIVIGSFLATLLIYDLLVKRYQVARFLFGMKPKADTGRQSSGLVSQRP